MDLSTCLLSIFSSSDGPGSDFIFANSIKMAKFQLFIWCFDNLLDFAFFVFFDVLFMFNRKFDYLGLEFPVLSHQINDLVDIWNFILKEKLFWCVNQIDHRLWGKEEIFIQNFNL